MTIELSSTDKRDGKALALFARCAEWQTGHTKDGRPFFAIPASEQGAYHMADARDCSCQDRQQRATICKHMRAVRLWLAAYATGAVSPRRETGAEDDRVALAPAGAELLAEQPPRASYNDVFGVCDANGCGEDRQRGERYCEKHELVDAF